MKSLSSKTRVELDLIKKSWLNHEEDSKNLSLNETKEITNYLKAMVISDISRILPPPIATPITFMPIGYYPRRMGFKPHEPYCEIMGWGKIEGSGVELCVLKAYGAENLLKMNNLVPYMFYETVITFDPMKKKAGLINGSLHQDTMFEGNTVEPPYLPNSIPERQKFILTLISKSSPVKLAEANKHLSNLISVEVAPNIRSKPYVDRTDFRIIQVAILNIRTGRAALLDWGVLEVTDGSFLPTLDHKAFQVWCDPALLSKRGVENGSYVKIIGTIELDCREKYPQMTACSIIPEPQMTITQKLEIQAGQKVLTEAMKDKCEVNYINIYITHQLYER